MPEAALASQVAGSLDQLSRLGGIAGTLLVLIIVGMSYAVMSLWKDNKVLRKEKDDTSAQLAKVLDTLGDKRVQEAREVRTAVFRFAEDNNKVIANVGLTIDALRDAVCALREIIVTEIRHDK